MKILKKCMMNFDGCWWIWIWFHGLLFWFHCWMFKKFGQLDHTFRRHDHQFFNDNPSSSLSKLSFEGSPIWKIPKVSWIPNPLHFILLSQAEAPQPAFPISSSTHLIGSRWSAVEARQPTVPHLKRCGWELTLLGSNFLAGTWYLRIGSNDFFCRSPYLEDKIHDFLYLFSFSGLSDNGDTWKNCGYHHPKWEIRRTRDVTNPHGNSNNNTTGIDVHLESPKPFGLSWKLGCPSTLPGTRHAPCDCRVCQVMDRRNGRSLPRHRHPFVRNSRGSTPNSRAIENLDFVDSGLSKDGVYIYISLWIIEIPPVNLPWRQITPPSQFQTPTCDNIYNIWYLTTTGVCKPWSRAKMTKPSKRHSAPGKHFGAYASPSSIFC